MRHGEGVGLSLRQVLVFYFYVVTVATLLVMVTGISRLVQAGLALPLGKEFSYNPVYYADTYPVVRTSVEVPPGVTPAPAEPQEATGPDEQARQKGLDQAFKEGILSGVMFTVVGGIFWLVHQWGRRRFAQSAQLLEQLYLLALLSIFAGLTLYYLPTGLYDTLRYYVAGVRTDYNPPGGTLAMGIVSLPIWLFYLSAAFRKLRVNRGGAAS